MFRRTLLTASTLAVAMVGCGSPPIILPPNDAGVVIIGNPDGGVIFPNPDGGPPPPPVMPNQPVYLGGYAYRLDSYLAQDPLPVIGAQVYALGVNGVQPVAAGQNGEFLMQVPQNGAVLLNAGAPLYWPSYENILVADRNVIVPLRVAYGENVRLQAERNGVVGYDQEFNCHAPNVGLCKYAFVMAQVVDDGSYDNGTPTPLAGVAAADITISVDNIDTWYVKGPYFNFPNGAPDPAGTQTQREKDANDKYRGGLFVFFVEIPTVGPPSHDLKVSIASLAGGAVTRVFGPSATKVFSGSFTWVTVREGGGGGGGIGPPPPPPPPPPPDQADFETQIYPLFLPVPQGGFGCQGCHTNEGGAVPAAGLNLYGGAANAYAGLDPAQYPQRVNVQNPAQSLLLTKPLYEADGNQNHPIFAFASTAEPAYQTILAWITGGGNYDGQVPLPPVSFYNDIRPLLYAQTGLGCYSCHVNGVDANTAPGGLYMGGDGNALWAELTTEPALDNGATGEQYRINKQGNISASLLLTNPLIGSPEPHPGKLIQNANDPNYQKIYRWIAEGYINDTP